MSYAYPDVDLANVRAAQIHATLLSLKYPPAAVTRPGWLLQRAYACKGHSVDQASFVIFWVSLPVDDVLEPQECGRAERDNALTGIALDLQLLGFPAVAQGQHFLHGGLVAVMIAA